ncbi:MAG: hypothetical protein ABI706_07795 [Ilumatobacteraceae bacterium]
MAMFTAVAQFARRVPAVVIMRTRNQDRAASPRTSNTGSFAEFGSGDGQRQAAANDDWLVGIVAHSPGSIDTDAIRFMLEQSDLGGDIERFVAGTKTISMAVIAVAGTELKARRRVAAKVKDTLGLGWTVQAESDDPV